MPLLFEMPTAQRKPAPFDAQTAAHNRLSLEIMFKDGYKDGYTGELLPQKRVEDAMINEMQHFNKLVWELSSTEAAAQVPSGKVIGGGEVGSMQHR